MTAKPDPVLETATPGDFVGLDAYCPVHGCTYETPASATVVNEYGVRDLVPRRCPGHNVLLRVRRIVEVVA